IMVVLGKREEPVHIGVGGQETKEGVKLTQVATKSPADKAGLKVDDVVTAVDKKPVTKLEQMQDALKGRKPGDKLNLTVLRGKEMKAVVVVLEPRPGPPRPYSAWLGGQRENAQDQQGKDGWQYGGVYRSADGGETWQRVNSLNPRPMYFS